MLIAISISYTLTAMTQTQNLFSDFAHRDNVSIALRKYGLKEVPKDVGDLKNVIVLIIAPDSVQDSWTVYPPLSAFDEHIDKPPFRYLPDEITTLTKLRDLTLTKLAIKTLPANFERLADLEKLDLSINKLTIKNEIDKIVKLKSLKHLILFGNRVTKEDVIQLKTANPSLFIDVEELLIKKSK